MGRGCHRQDLRWLQGRLFSDSAQGTHSILILLLYPLTLAQHHCRMCGKVYCHNCSQQTAVLPLEYGYGTAQRVCGPCHATLSSNEKQRSDMLILVQVRPISYLHIHHGSNVVPVPLARLCRPLTGASSAGHGTAQTSPQTRHADQTREDQTTGPSLTGTVLYIRALLTARLTSISSSCPRPRVPCTTVTASAVKCPW